MKMKTIISKKNTIYNKVHLMKKNNGTEENDEKYTNHEYILYIHVFLTEKIMVFLIKKYSQKKKITKNVLTEMDLFHQKKYIQKISKQKKKKKFF